MTAFFSRFGKLACKGGAWRRLVLCVLISRILYNLHQNGLLTIYPTSGSCILIAGIWMRMGTSRIPHIVIYPAIVYKPRFQLNLLYKSKFFKQALQNQKDLVIIKSLFGAIQLSCFRYYFICLVCTRTRTGRHKKVFFSISIVS